MTEVARQYLCIEGLIEKNGVIVEREPWSKIIKEHQVLIGLFLIALAILIVGIRIAIELDYLRYLRNLD